MMLELTEAEAAQIVIRALKDGISEGLSRLVPGEIEEVARTVARVLAARMKPHVEFDEEGILQAIAIAGQPRSDSA